MPEPQTCFGSWLSALQSVPAAAAVKVGCSGDGPLHAGIWHTVAEVGRSVGASTEVVPPMPLQKTSWQSPGALLASVTVDG